MGQWVRRSRGPVVGAALGAALAWLAGRWLIGASRRIGAYPGEVAARLPGDDTVDHGAHVSTHAITIAAPPERIWPWLVQMGHHRGGWYAADRLEALMGAGTFATGRSARRVVPELQDLGLGDRVPLSDSLDLEVIGFDPPHTLVLELRDAPLTWVWSFHLVADGAGPARTRLVVRTRVDAHGGLLRLALGPLDLGHGVMQTVQLHRIRRRVRLLSC